MRNLRYMDAVFSRFLDQLREVDQFDDSLLIVTSDHAWREDPALPPYDLSAADGEPFSAYKHVPLWIKAPGQTVGEVVDRRFTCERYNPWCPVGLPANRSRRSWSRRAVLRKESYRRGSVKSTLLQVVAQGLAFVFNMVMAACFGAIVATDVFNYCVTTFTMVAGFMLALIQRC